MNPYRVLPIFLLALTAFAADVANLSGVWVLNVKRSQWGKKEQPLNAEVTIQHSEPKYNYTGSVTRSADSQPDRFTFDGTIDGKQYPIKEDTAKRMMAVKRKNDSTIESTITNADGKVEETATTSLSKDGKTLVRKISLTAPDGKKATWTEIYEKKS